MPPSGASYGYVDRRRFHLAGRAQAPVQRHRISRCRGWFRGPARAGFGSGLGGPGGDLLSHALRRSTIGAEGFHGRVRDGIGCGPLAIATRPAKPGSFVGWAGPESCLIEAPGHPLPRPNHPCMVTYWVVGPGERVAWPTSKTIQARGVSKRIRVGASRPAGPRCSLRRGPAVLSPAIARIAGREFRLGSSQSSD